MMLALLLGVTLPGWDSEYRKHYKIYEVNMWFYITIFSAVDHLRGRTDSYGQSTTKRLISANAPR